MKYLVLMFVVLAAVTSYGQLCQDAESDTLLVSEARASLRYNLNDYKSPYSWPDSVLNDFLNQSSRKIASMGASEKRDTLVTAANTVYYALNSDFMSLRGVMVKNAGRWSPLLKPDTSGYGMLIKLDTIITVDNTMMYTLNNDFLSDTGVIIKQTNRWMSLYPVALKGSEGDKPYGRPSSKGVNYYTILDKYLMLDVPPIEGGDTIVVGYSAFEYFVSDKRLVVNSPVAGDSMIVFYKFMVNELTGDAVIINLPYEYRTELIEGAVQLAIRANQY